MTAKETFDFSSLKVPLFLLAIFWSIAVILWQTTGKIFYLFNFGYIGTSLGIGIGVYSTLPKRLKPWGRRLSQFLVGAYMLVFLGLIERENMQVEGFFFYLLGGVFAGAVIHYLIAKVFGPALFNRGWCGWACWTAMLLDLLPFRRNPCGRLPAKWGHLRYIHFGLSLILVLVLWFGVGYRVEDQSSTELWWLLAGNVFYYLTALGLAFSLKDNRAFCKYACPIPVMQKVTSRFSLIKIEADAAKCNDCAACVKTCPMDIRIPEYTRQGKRVLSTECILCFDCVNACPKGALDATFKLDGANLELLRYRDNP